MRFAMFAALILTLGACASTGAPASSHHITVAVENHNWHTATVYMVDGAHLQRLGTVERGHPRTFRVRYPARGVIQLAAHLAADAGAVRTDAIPVDPGVRVVWFLEGNLPNSHYTVRD